MKRIWMKPDGIRWLLQKKKTTTFRENKHIGMHDIVRGSWYNTERVGVIIELVPSLHCASDIIIYNKYSTEGDFKNPDEFIAWLKANKLTLPEFGWLHEIIYVSADAKGLTYSLQETLKTFGNTNEGV